MARNRASAKKAGTSFETLIVRYLARHVDDRIERRRLSGVNDRGDITGLKHMGQRVVVECKNYGGRIQPGPWFNEVEVERGNDDMKAEAETTGEIPDDLKAIAGTLKQLLARIHGAIS